MNGRPLCLLAGLLVMGCAPAFPARPELPPIAPETAQASDAGTVPAAAPAIPKPDLSKVGAELQGAGIRSTRADLRAVPAQPPVR